LYFAVAAVFYWMIAVSWGQFLLIWRNFQTLLETLETSSVRNAFSRLQKEISWMPLVSRIPERQYYISMRCLDTLNGIRNFDAGQLRDGTDALESLQTALFKELAPNSPGEKSLTDFRDAVSTSNPDKEVPPQVYYSFHHELERIVDIIFSELSQHQWKRGDSDSIRREEANSRRQRVSGAERLQILEEEFLALRVLIFMRYVYRHLRNLLGFIVAGFVLSTISLQSYAFQDRHWIGLSSMVVFIGLGAGIATVFAQMDRDAILSRITDTKSNELGLTFVYRIAQFGILPLITLLAGQFPWFNQLFFSWVQPALSSLR